ncbi:hypothetical protein, partial [Microbulbifer sp. 2205BS26-8]|uniref:hypothetical protein n=1 Tax=Microbulbifer sp. 2205BS26-8 TaxID=3064386 RepID=UPI00273E5208
YGSWGLSLVLVSGFVTFIKTGKPPLFKEMCQIWSELIHIQGSRRAPGWPCQVLFRVFYVFSVLLYRSETGALDGTARRLKKV